MKHAALDVVAITLSVALVAGCGDDDGAPAMDAGPSRPDTRADVPRTDAGPAPPPSADWCDRVRTGPAGANALPVDLAIAHGAIRFFAAERAYSTVDQALAGALGHPLPFDPDVLPVTLATYAAALDGVCAGAAEATPVGPARVERADPAVIVRPGTGSVSLPSGTTVVAIDLRDLPDAPNLAALVEAAVAPTLATDIARPSRRVRTHYGMTDEYVASVNLFSNRTFVVDAPPIPARGDAELTLVFLTGPSLPPAAAEIVGTLRLAGRAWIVGEDIQASVAESRWQGVGEHGLSYRAMDLLISEDVRWPDVIPADEPASRTNEVLATVSEPPPPLTPGEATRSAIAAMAPFGDVQPPVFSLGTGRAALMSAHAAARFFHPYSQSSFDALDGRLEETVADLDGSFEPEPELLFQLLRRFAHVLADGQAFVVDQAEARGMTGLLPLVLETLRSEHVVRRSGLADVVPGEVIVSIDGVPFGERVAVELERTSAATSGNRIERATRQVLVSGGDVMLVVRGLDMVEREVIAAPVTRAEYAVLLGSSGQPNGRLDALGAPDIHYLNLDSTSIADIESLRTLLADADGAAGLVLDLRGFPVVDMDELAARLLSTPEDSPRFVIPTWVGLDERSADDRQYVVVPVPASDPPSFAGPVVLIVGPDTVSTAENFASILLSARRATIVGRPSAGTSGGISGIQLPGSFALTFSSTEVRLPNGDVFHGIGLRPDVNVRLSASQLAAGIDPELAAAIDQLQ